MNENRVSTRKNFVLGGQGFGESLVISAGDLSYRVLLTFGACMDKGLSMLTKGAFPKESAYYAYIASVPRIATLENTEYTNSHPYCTH
jgi:hypothetical protein